MANITFIQRSRIGRAIFLLRSETLEVITSSLRGKSSQSFPLRTISPEYRCTAERVYSIIITPLVFAGASAWLMDTLLAASHPLAQGFLLYAILGFAAFGWIALRGVPRVELFVFFDRSERPLFYIVREKHQASECEAFVHELLDRIEMIRQGVGPDEIHQPPCHEESSVRLPARQPTRVLGPTEARWKISLLAGGLSSGFQPVVENMILLHDWILPVVFLSSVAGILFGVLSFLAKERLRYLALFGMALSLVALIFS